MKAVVINRFSDHLDEVTVSQVAAPSPNEQDILIKVVAAGVNFVDTLYVRLFKFSVKNTVRYRQC